MEPNGENREKKLTDIALVTYLVCENFKIKKIERHKFKSLFIFDETKELKEAMLIFFNHEARVDPLKFSETLRNLKSLIKQG